jgi:hypothetical protein
VGTITIVKNAVPNDPQDFSFTGDLGAFSLDDDADGTLPSSQTFPGLAPGPYAVTESAPPSPWTLSSITCNDPDSGTVVALPTVTIDLDAGETITCTFVNVIPTVGVGGVVKVRSLAGAPESAAQADRGGPGTPWTLLALAALGVAAAGTGLLYAGQRIRR